MSKYQGQCGCGKVEYCFEGEPINTAFCYCDECQKHTGSDKWFGIWVAAEQFEFSKGKVATFTRKGDSGQDMHHKFCSDCGTTLAIDVTVGNFYSVAASTLLKCDFSPNMAIYTASAPHWAVFPEGVPKFDTLPADIGG